MNSNEQVNELLFPKNIEDWLPKVAPPEPPKPPSMLSEDQKDVEKEDPDFLRDSLGMKDREAAMSALNEPYLWEPDELTLFENVLTGEDYDRSELSELIQAQVEGRRSRPEAPIEAPKRAAEPEDFDNEPFDPPQAPVREPDIQNLGEMGSIDVGNWWEK